LVPRGDGRRFPAAGGAGRLHPVMEVYMRTLAFLAVLLLAVPVVATAGGPLDFGLHTEAMDGVNTFPAQCHVSEDVHSSPQGPCGGWDSDMLGESSAYHYFVAAGSYVDTPLPAGGCMDIRQFWISWDSSNFYLGVQGPNELWERGDLFIAIDTDNMTGGNLASAPWAKSVDFGGWVPDYFIALEAPTSTGGYAALLDGSFNVVRDVNSGLLTADSGYRSCDDGGMYYEFAIPLADIGVTYGPGQQVNFAIYTTYEDDGFDTYDTGPGCGQGVTWEELGDYPYDADHCGTDVDPVTGTTDASCGNAESDDALGAGVATSGRYPASDNSPSDIDTIQEYYAITNFAQEPPTPALPSTWGRLKALY